MGATFNVPANPAATVAGVEPGLDGVPDVDPFYAYEEERLRDFGIFWVCGMKAAMIEGDPSAGKTSLIEQWHAALNVPLYKVPCSPDLQRNDLYGQLLPDENGKLKWVDGPVIRACREGSSCLLDEYNTLDGGISTGLNLILEGKSWMIPETGEIIKPGKTTRFFATQNAVDGKSVVSGRNVQDTANEDRFFYMRVDYLKPELEEEIVIRRLVAGRINEGVAKTIASLTVGVANDVRKAFRGELDENGKPYAGAEEIEKPLSTRAVLRWAVLTAMYQQVFRGKKRSGLHYAIRRAVKMPESMAIALNDAITLKAGYGPDGVQ